MSGSTDDRPDVGGGVATAGADPARRWLDGVRAELADLPADEVSAVLDDVRAHLAGVAEELGADLGEDDIVRRLGTPARYAAELRAAGGYPAPAPARAGRVPAMIAVAALVVGSTVAVVGVLLRLDLVVMGAGLLVSLAGLPLVHRAGPSVPRVAALPAVRPLLDAVPRRGTATSGAGVLLGLQPVWWVLRAVAVVLVLTGLIRSFRLAPWALVELGMVSVLAVPVSIALGLYARRDRRLLWLVVPLNAVAAALTVWSASVVGPEFLRLLG